MPIFEYQCPQCGHRFDHLARTLTDVARKCSKCGARNPEKLLSTFNAAVAPVTSACSTGVCPTGTCSVE